MFGLGANAPTKKSAATSDGTRRRSAPSAWETPAIAIRNLTGPEVNGEERCWEMSGYSDPATVRPLICAGAICLLAPGQQKQGFFLRSATGIKSRFKTAMIWKSLL